MKQKCIQPVILERKSCLWPKPMIYHACRFIPENLQLSSAAKELQTSSPSLILQWTPVAGSKEPAVGTWWEVGLLGAEWQCPESWQDPTSSYIWPWALPNIRSISQGSDFVWPQLSVSPARYEAHLCTQWFLPMWNAILPLYGLCGLQGLVGNHGNRVVKQHGSWHVIKCYHSATPERSPLGGVILDAPITSLSSAVLGKKSSMVWRMKLAWEGRYQPLIQLKVLKTQKPTIFILSAFNIWKVWMCAHTHLLPACVRPRQGFLEKTLDLLS